MEFSVEVECPHCGDESQATVEFDEGTVMSPYGGGGSTWTKLLCFNCEKTFYFETSVMVEVEVEQTAIKKPKGYK